MEYHVNKTAQDNGDHEVHEQGCYWLSIAQNTEHLGNFSDCSGAVSEAKRRGYSTANGCKHCSELCNTG